MFNDNPFLCNDVSKQKKVSTFSICIYEIKEVKTQAECFLNNFIILDTL